jgi:DJ-1 family protein
MNARTTAILLADGFEEAEAFITLDILERLGIPVTKISCNATAAVTSYHNLHLAADTTLTQSRAQLFDAIILPGGPAGTDNLTADHRVTEFIRHHIEEQRYICAICSAPAKVLARHELLQRHRYVCSGDLQNTVQDGVYVDQPVVVDDKFITGKGLGYAFDFGLTIADILLDHDPAVARQAEHIYHPFQPIWH